MRVLAINTVGSSCEAALIDGEAEWVVVEPMARGHDARVAAIAEQAREKSGLDWTDLDRIAVVCGPGSFTGVRVGVSFARGLGLALEIPVIGVTSLEALNPTPPPGPTLGALAAKKRPPGRSWWTQRLLNGAGAGACEETAEADLPAAWAGAVAILGDDAFPVPPCLAPIVAEPSALAAARFARTVDPAAHPPHAIYAREPDAAPMKGLS